MTLEVFPYQAAAASVMSVNERFGLHDEMGIGKTATTIRAIDIIGAERGIVIAPANLRENWIGEFRKFGRSPLKICKGLTIHDFYAWQRGRFNVLVTSYEQAAKWANHIRGVGEPLDFIAIDEAHYLKNPETGRTRAILGREQWGHNAILEWAQHAWHITGTPMSNDCLDIWTFLRMCGVMPLGLEAFTRRYFHKEVGAYSVRTVPKPEMIAELKKLIDENSIRRTASEVGIQLPRIFLTEALLDGDTSAVKDMLLAYPDLEKAIVRALEQGGLSFLDAPYISTLRRLVGEAKAIPYAHMLIQELESGGGKRVVYGIHVDALTTISTILSKAGIKNVLVNGATTERASNAAVWAFQNDPTCLVFIGNIRKAGVGVTLTASDRIDLFESDWTPSGNAQAIKRIHRIGQLADAVHARFLTLARSVDELVNRIVAEKTANIAAVGNAMIASPAIDLSRQLV